MYPAPFEYGLCETPDLDIDPLDDFAGVADDDWISSLIANEEDRVTGEGTEGLGAWLGSSDIAPDLAEVTASYPCPPCGDDVDPYLRYDDMAEGFERGFFDFCAKPEDGTPPCVASVPTSPSGVPDVNLDAGHVSNCRRQENSDSLVPASSLTGQDAFGSRCGTSSQTSTPGTECRYSRPQVASTGGQIGENRGGNGCAEEGHVLSSGGDNDSPASSAHGGSPCGTSDHKDLTFVCQDVKGTTSDVRADHVSILPCGGPIVYKSTSSTSYGGKQEKQAARGGVLPACRGSEVKVEERERFGRGASEDGEEEDPQSDGSDGMGGGGAGGDKKQARLLRNRESAQLSRQRKKVYMDDLEGRLHSLQAQVSDLNKMVSHLTCENVGLRRQLAYFCPPPGTMPPGAMPGVHPGVVPMAFGPGGMYPVINGFSPAVPIPRLKGQKGLETRKGGGRKNKGSGAGRAPEGGGKRAKKVAGGVGAVALALFCFASVFGPFDSAAIPGLGFGWGLEREDGAARVAQVAGGHGMGRVLMGMEEGEGDEWVNHTVSVQGTGWGRGRGKNGYPGEKDRVVVEPGVLFEYKGGGGVRRGELTGFNGKIVSGGSNRGRVVGEGEALPVQASLMVPKGGGGQLMKVDGNLIIKAIMAGDKAAIRDGGGKGMEVGGHSLVRWGGEEGVVRARQEKKLKTLARVAVEGGWGEVEALPPGEEEEEVPGGSRGQIGHEWLLGGMAGPILSSGVCTEVFQFDTSPSANEGAPKSSTVSNRSASETGRVPAKKGLPNRRDPFAVEQALANGSVNLSPNGGNSRNGGNDGSSGGNNVGASRERRVMAGAVGGVGELGVGEESMVVSVLASPGGERSKERGGGGGGGGGGVTQVFVVVLVNGVRYVTYACKLPLIGGGERSSVVAS